MAYEKLKLKDLPDDLKEACEERGFGENSTFSFEEALAEWAAWNIGDSAWAREMVQMQKEFERVAGVGE